jgi:hypothetical protein
MMFITLSCSEVLDDIDGERFPSNLVWVAVGNVGVTTDKSVVCAMLELVFREQSILFLLGTFLVGVACVLSLWQQV